MANKYDSEFVGIMRQGALTNKMFELIKAHPEDQDIIIDAYVKQNKVAVDYEHEMFKNWMIEY